MSSIVITRVSASYFNTWEEFECELPYEYGLVLISGKAGSAKTSIAKIIRWTILGEKASDEEISTPKWASDWKTTKTEIEMTQKQYDGTIKKFTLSRTKNKNSKDSVLNLSIDDGVVITDNHTIISNLSNLTNLKLNTKLAEYMGDQDQKWWFYKAELQTQVLEKFEQVINFEKWCSISGTDKLIKRLEDKEKEITKVIENMPGWSEKDKTNLNKWNTEMKKQKSIMDTERGIILQSENDETKFKKDNPNWKKLMAGSQSMDVTTAYQNLDKAEKAIGANKFDSSNLIKYLNSSVSVALERLGLNDKIPSKEPKKVLDALSIVTSSWSKFDSLQKKDKELMIQSSKDKGLSCQQAGYVNLSHPNQTDYNQFISSIKIISENSTKLEDLKITHSNSSKSSQLTDILFRISQAEKRYSTASGNYERAKEEVEILTTKKLAASGKDDTGKKRAAIKKLKTILTKSMKSVADKSYKTRVNKANEILINMGANMELVVKLDEATNENKLYRKASGDIDALVNSEDVNGGHKAILFSALVAAELDNSSLTLPPMLDDSISVADTDGVHKVISGLHSWAIATDRQIFMITNIDSNDEDKLQEWSNTLTKIIFCSTPDSDFRKRNNQDWRFVSGS